MHIYYVDIYIVRTAAHYAKEKSGRLVHWPCPRQIRPMVKARKKKRKRTSNSHAATDDVKGKEKEEEQERDKEKEEEHEKDKQDIDTAANPERTKTTIKRRKSTWTDPPTPDRTEDDHDEEEGPKEEEKGPEEGPTRKKKKKKRSEGKKQDDDDDDDDKEAAEMKALFQSLPNNLKTKKKRKQADAATKGFYDKFLKSVKGLPKNIRKGRMRHFQRRMKQTRRLRK